MKKPIDIPTRETAAFVESHVPARSSILEVGCGAGHLAEELLRRGYDIKGLDSNEEVVAQAQARGAPAVRGTWPEFEHAPVDAIIFTQSLHHIHGLAGAVRRARELLRPGGRILIEDFAFNELDHATTQWFQGLLRGHPGAALITPAPGSFLTRLLASEHPADEWRHGHGHDLHTAAAMTQAIAEDFCIQAAIKLPYLYRYLVPLLPETPEAAEFVDAIFREEARAGELGEITLIGRRVVGSPNEGGAA